MTNELPVIKKLDETVSNRIAAFEVIQRPANAVKELIENSLDAKSTNVQVTVKNGGLKYIQIQDNGVGIRKEDFSIVCERFTTSKLRKYEDLNTIATYGFRGEALASISHVAHVTIQSKTALEQCAYRAQFTDGKLNEAPKLIAGNQGTQIIIEDLFYNMSVRKKALKSASEEYQKISEIIGKYAIHNCSVGFSLKKFGENNDIRTPVGSTQQDNIRTIYGNSIARELVEFEMENEKFKFKANGLMTNVNYSTKKLNFILFINHRLVDCQSLRKSIDQVYTNYLPKNMHPFFYLSLELDPYNVDVNVHPTKHEVHFLNEEQIVEIITAEIEKKLLGSNNSRLYYTQAKLPVITSNGIQNSSKEKTERVYPKELVRTDFANQKLEKFFGATVKKSGSLQNIEQIDYANRSYNEEHKNVEHNAKKTDEDDFFEKKNEEFLKDNENFETKLLDKTIVDSPRPKKKIKKEFGFSPLGGVIIDTANDFEITRVECELSSVLELRNAIEDNCHPAMRELFTQHVFVGCISPSQALIQHNTKLYLCNTEKIMEVLFCQFVLYNFQNFGIINFCDPLPIKELALAALNLPDTGWTPEDGDKNELAEKITEILTEKGEMLKEYFSMEIDEYGNLKSLPLLLEKHVPEMTGLPMFILRLSTEVNWENEKDCFESFAKETGKYYSFLEESSEENHNWKWLVEHVFYPAIKEYFLPPRSFTTNAVVVELADLPNLYKVFERC